MDSRPLSYFVAVAEELNFARAAERLGISPPPLSRAIRRLEADLGVTLFERTTHSVTLTPAGTVLLAEARIALDALQAAARRAQRAAAPEPKLVLAVKADGDGGTAGADPGAVRVRPAAVPVAVRLCGWHEEPRLLRQRRGRRGPGARAVRPHRPGHRDAGRRTACRGPRRHAPARRPGPTGPRRPRPARRRPAPATSTRSATPGPRPRPTAHAGRHSARRHPLFPASVAARYPRPGVVYRPVTDAPAAVLAIAGPQQSRSTATAALVRAATAVGDAAAAVADTRAAS